MNAFGSVASAGRGRWQWFLWRDYRQLCDADPVAGGTAGDRECAVEQLMDAARGLGLALDPSTIRAWGAQQWRKVLATRKRLSRPSRQTGAQPQEFVYRHYLMYDDETTSNRWETERHRILRRTRRYIFVNLVPDEPFYARSEGYTWASTLLVDTIALEGGRAVTHRQFRWSKFNLSPTPPACLDQDPPCSCPAELAASLELLGLSWPFTAPQLRAAYRRASLEHHPDRGGTTATMQALNEAHERLAMALAGRR
jgi:hypothetical protein